MNIGILIPTLREARRFIVAAKMKPTAASRFVYEAPGISVALQICGMGTGNARRHAETILSQGIEFLVLAGFCGGLNKGLKPGDLVVDNQRPDADFAAALMQIANARNITFHIGAIYTSPKLLAKPEDKIHEGIQSTAIAVDMEGAGVLELCRARNLPFRSFRTVSDGVEQRLPSALRHMTLNGKTTWRFWPALACRPWEWPNVFRALISARLAEKNLSAVLLDWVRGFQTAKIHEGVAADK